MFHLSNSSEAIMSLDCQLLLKSPTPLNLLTGSALSKNRKASKSEKTLKKHDLKITERIKRTTKVDGRHCRPIAEVTEQHSIAVYW